MADSWNRLPFCNLSMACLSDSSLGGWLTQFDLDIVNAFQLQESLPCTIHNLVTLVLGESRQV
tara:strand:+ start:351 stop:539 length:189 start_codon:yes stop_codon:yes gene_type:complete